MWTSSASSAAQVCDVERSRVRATVRADKPRAVNRKTHGKVLDRDIMNNLIIGALQEGRINRAKGAHPLCRQPRREGHGMLLGNADVERAVGVGFGKFVDAGAARHRRRDRDNARIGFGDFGKCFAEDVLV
jgi:hypothetical protein